MKLGHQDAGCATDQGGVDADAQAKAVKYRQDRKNFLAGDAAKTGGGAKER